ncbi:MAG: ribosomal protein S18-alanine N-acetyltransferase [Gemmatimonas sp.]|jgi:ribosomal-protein-alanine N-acetyltransferase|uniref:ribosomal protein S18-alanine N-acetyltransferase n=1 Tax=Gemmatimonas sp. TaxID=1962908 RepID=UPI00391F9B04|nr:ribosomal protein S18-alanine N-acetyltransferase [Gemmatimonadota bacterium]
MDAGHVAAVARIEASAFSDPWPASAFSELLERAYARLRVAVTDDGTLCGYCVLLRAADEGEIANIATEPSVRQQGVAGRLLDDALAAADANGAASVYLEVRVSNEAARALYASRGFRQVGRRRGYYDRPAEDALVLRRTRP